MSDREKYALQIDAAAVLAEVNAILAVCGLDPAPDDTTIARLALLRGWVLEALAKDTANRKRLAQCEARLTAMEAERNAARQVIGETDLILRCPAAEYVPAIGDEFTLIDRFRKAAGLDRETRRS